MGYSFVGLLHHLRHRTTFLGAVATRLGAGDHLLISGKFLASGSALLTAFGTTLRRMPREIALPCAQSRTQFAAFRAVHAEIHAFGMVLFPVAHERCAVLETRIALNLAICTVRGTLQQMGSVRAVFGLLGCERELAHNVESQGDCTQGEHSMIHDHCHSFQKKL
jgi:hypothetical protein